MGIDFKGIREAVSRALAGLGGKTSGIGRSLRFGSASGSGEGSRPGPKSFFMTAGIALGGLAVVGVVAVTILTFARFSNIFNCAPAEAQVSASGPLAAGSVIEPEVQAAYAEPSFYGLDQGSAFEVEQDHKLLAERAQKQELAKAEVAQRRLELIKTGVDAHRVPYAQLIGQEGLRMTCKVGEVVSGARVMGIMPGRVVLMLSGKRIILEQAAAGASEPLVTFVSDSETTSSAKASHAFLDNKQKLLGRSKLKLDVSRGYVLTDIDSASPLYAAGLRDGDALCSLNGAPLNNRRNTQAAYEALGGATAVTIEYERDGEILDGSISL